RSVTVKDGDTLDLGNKTLKFISAPNLHWPDSMYTWLEDDKVLFTCDSFGAHYCDAGMSDDLSDDYLKAFKYYFDVILKPFSRFMIKAIERIRPLDAGFICTGHGPILRENRNKIVDLTEKYAREYLDLTGEKARRRVLIAYVSAYGYTKMAAEFIAGGIREISDFTVELADIELMEPGEMDALLTLSDALLVGSPTINQNTLLPVYKLFAVINPLRDRGKLAGVFGSYGWSGEAPAIIHSALKNLKLKVMDEPASFKFLPGGEKEEMLREYGRKFGRQFEEECAGK
ncbi:MAG TPA: FprA family A-type flavoprotein, partial [Bacteroidales bacterium]|nr:FprA family A-type flavoprotein [Bacteroidales bacterium]